MNEIEKRMQELITFFNDFRLTTITDEDNIKIYAFKHPNTNNLSQTWIIHNERLIVTGDAGDAIYYASSMRSLEAIAKLNLSYFTGKCEASRNGWQQSHFDADVATETVHEMIFEYTKTCLLHDYINVEFKDLKDFNWLEQLNQILCEHEDFSIYTDIPIRFDDEHDMWQFMREYGNDLCGEDWWDGFSITAKDNEPFWHLAAIKSAVKQI